LGSYGDNFGGNYDVPQTGGAGWQHRASIPVVLPVIKKRDEPKPEPEPVEIPLFASHSIAVIQNRQLQARHELTALLGRFFKASHEIKVNDLGRPVTLRELRQVLEGQGLLIADYEKMQVISAQEIEDIFLMIELGVQQGLLPPDKKYKVERTDGGFKIGVNN
jgi:hypothetical protein